ncbi:Rieske (2Fe-2S) protein [Actinophytocola sp.]|uniref:Rieske (2Fe-2S) protein n=1 Tax=Actinophytocola sp. TaxID=1872138 RepID=UPI003D6C2BD0
MIRQVSADEIEIDTGTLRVRAQSACPHRKGRLRFGFVNTRRMTITCPLHHSTFDLRTGERLSGPACGGLRVSVLESE